ncbi:carbamoyltransferase HypF [Petroclostridium sp. X23]|uniref:carbamoyltransferase HypF n=1 Tax=Petroclostridium sp. X23 TaxID=3045146 RepID=UPI0024AD8169|nr:carbamoyltransferase HypF [Petroclostridium sp. X23]WHH60789.1 carbamoyltransferase HypF [Petroclostridium sp. X23]
MNDLKRYTVHITGIVQGVGMRPHIYKTAKQLNLGGWVSNQGTSVVMVIVGRRKNIREFLAALLERPPSGAKISNIKIKSECYEEYNSFSIINSSTDNQLQGFIPPDTAICDECIKEIQDKMNRRYMYPFTNCTSCGPRYSIIKTLPYDRANTSMSDFKMCPACTSEYESPDNRRFHAQTNCCPDCGPKLALLDRKGRRIDSIHPVATARQLLHESKLIAIKGIGGYHLACNARDEKAVDLLRKRKSRPDRPLAIMAVSLEAAKLICKTTDKDEEILTSKQRPIVLLEKRLPELLPHNIAPGINRLGVMLPYTPLHYQLFHEELQYLIMTSGNVSGMPICYKDGEALEKLKDVADFFLVHDREILTPIDDSVVWVIDEKEMVSRNARGYSPSTLQIDSDSEIMAMGAQQKSSLCLLHKGYAHSSQYMGNLDEMTAYEQYLQAMKRMKALLSAEPQIIAHDLHTGYLSTKWAKKQLAERIPIQHHHAHMAACMAEHDLKKNAIGIIYDGTGIGTDGAIWGGEFLIGSKGKFSRIGHWKYVTLQGGDSAIKEPWKSAASYLCAMGINSEEFLDSVSSLKVKAIQNAIKHNINCFKSSSIGRLFDCVSAIVTKRMYITYDAQAAIEFESIIEPNVTDFYPYSIDEKEEKLEIRYEEIISDILRDMKDGKTASYLSAKFHNTVCEATINCVCKIRNRCGIDDIVLGGGVFENAYLLKNMKLRLKEHDFNVYHNMKIPINDGGIAFGQVAVAVQRVKEGNYVSGSSSKDYNHR